jgi:Arc/MetJ-type ribon-helix-helix transcriptional regulator
MTATKIAITLDAELLRKVDLLVAERRFPSRSRAIQEAVKIALDRLEAGRLGRESAKLDPKFEQDLAEQGLAETSGHGPHGPDIER